MKVGRRNTRLLHELETLYNLGAIGDLTDGQLLERCATDTSEVAELAFAALVERHQAMVWRICLAIVRDEHEAEDAFQATFLVLVRRARSLWVRDSLGPWLHQVACRTASCLRRTRLRRRHHEHRCAARDASCAGAIAIDAPRDLDRDAAVHQELDRLPEKYRAPIVLCDLQGRTHQEAARCLGWPIGTVKTRQLKARQLLRDRLAGRGLGPDPAGLVVASLRRNTLTAMPGELSRGTVQAAMRHSARLLANGEISARVVSLTRGVVRAMLWNRYQHLAAVILAVGMASGGAGAYVLGFQEPSPQDGQSASKPAASPQTQAPKPKGSKDAAAQPADADLRAKLRAQQIAARRARANYQIARLNRELAELAVLEYEEVTYPQDLAVVNGGIELAESDVAREVDRVEWARRMFDKKYVSAAQKVSEELNLEKARFSLEEAQGRRSVLKKYTRGKTLKELESAVEASRRDEQKKQAAAELESIRELELESQLRPRTN